MVGTTHPDTASSVRSAQKPLRSRAAARWRSRRRRARAGVPLAPRDSPPTMAPITAAFVLFGVYWGSWAVSAADVERTLGLSHAQFGLVLSAGLGGAAVANGVG